MTQHMDDAPPVKAISTGDPACPSAETDHASGRVPDADLPPREREPVLYVRSPETWRVLLSQVRSEVAQAVRCIGPCSIRDLAAFLQRPPDALYHHVGVLQNAGFLREVGRRKRGRHTEAVFDVTAEDFAIDFPSLNTREQCSALCETADCYMSLMARAVADAASAGELRLTEGSRNFLLNYDVTRLSPQDFTRAREILIELKQLLDRSRAQPGGELYAVAFVAAPITRSGRVRSAPEAPVRSPGGDTADAADTADTAPPK